jgi:apolipoprotein D and lipocalin family protein
MIQRALLRVLTIAVFVAALGMLGCEAGPPLDVASDVDLARFQGKWYEIARLPRTTQTDCHGTTAFYTQAPDGTMSFVNQCNVGGATGPLKTVSMTATVPNSSVPAKLALDVGGYVGDYWILEVGSNYEYAVVGHPSRLYWWVLSRTPSLDAITMKGVIARATTEQFDVSQLEYTPQPPAGERNQLTTPEGPIPPALSTGCAMARRRPANERRDTAWGLCLLAALALRARRATLPAQAAFARPALRSTTNMMAYRQDKSEKKNFD